MSRFKAMVFDCDGVLVNSEPLSMKVTQKALADLGWHVEMGELYDRFMGCSKQFLITTTEKHVGKTLPAEWLDEYRGFRKALFRRDLTAIPHVEDALNQIDVPIAVASNSSHDHIGFVLELAGLTEFFQGHIASAEDVAEGKPAPDVYLLAASQLGFEPDECIAIDDSRTGVLAAMAAGMHVFAYDTPLTPAGSFDDLDVPRVRSMKELPALVGYLIRAA